jgi:hypothetical protein
MNMSGAFPAIFGTVNIIIALIGVCLFIHAWWALNQFYGPSGKGMSPGVAFVRMSIGTVLSSAVYFIVLTKNTLIGTEVSGAAMGYQTAGLTAVQKASVDGLFGLFQILGLIAFAKGWLIIDAHVTSSKQSSGWGGGLTFIIAGTFCVFMREFLALLTDLTGINLINILLF